MAVRKNISLKKREGASNIIFHIILRLLGRFSSGKEGKEAEIFRKKIKILRKYGWGRIISCRELYIPLKIFLSFLKNSFPEYNGPVSRRVV